MLKTSYKAISSPWLHNNCLRYVIINDYEVSIVFGNSFHQSNSSGFGFTVL